jgi:hypothetical protein
MQTPVSIYVSSGTIASCATVCNSVGDDELILTLGDTYDDNGYTTDFATDTLGGAGFSFWDG